LPGIKINTGPDDFRPIKHMRLVQFDSRTWQLIGDVIETAFSDTRADMNERLRIRRTIE
jgi:branched-chain amino acid transport system substrate-binding protein